MGKSLEYALKVMPTKEAGRRNIIELGLGRACKVPMGRLLVSEIFQILCTPY